MRKQLAIAVAAALTAAPAWASEVSVAPKEEKIGLGTGAALGAIAGGPIGMVLGAALGGWAGDKFHQERAQRLDYEHRYESAQAEADSFEGLLRDSERKLAEVRTMLAAEKRGFESALEEALELQVYFRTEQSTLDEVTEQRLAEVAGLIRDIDDFTIFVEGHTDARGTEDYNELLSAQRAAAVRDVLLRAGVAPERITTHEAGETQSTAVEGDVDSLALERRVDLKIMRMEPTLVGATSGLQEQ